MTYSVVYRYEVLDGAETSGTEISLQEGWETRTYEGLLAVSSPSCFMRLDTNLYKSLWLCLVLFVIFVLYVSTFLQFHVPAATRLRLSVWNLC